MLTRTLAFLDGVPATGFEGSEAKVIVLRPGTPKEKKMDGEAYLASYGLPQFFFHVHYQSGRRKHTPSMESPIPAKEFTLLRMQQLSKMGKLLFQMQRCLSMTAKSSALVIMFPFLPMQL
jgi:hypothetical protein